jgi:hypothetical protein
VSAVHLLEKLALHVLFGVSVRQISQ